MNLSLIAPSVQRGEAIVKSFFAETGEPSGVSPRTELRLSGIDPGEIVAGKTESDRDHDPADGVLV